MSLQARFSQFQRIAVPVFCMLTVGAWSATLQITGTVKSSLGPFINQGTVVLMHQAMTTTTAANGTFSFTGTLGTINNSGSKPERQAPFFIKGNSFLFSTSTPGEAVTIQLFDMHGCLLQTISQRFSCGGRQVITIGSDELAKGVILARFSSKSLSGSLRFCAGMFCSKVEDAAKSGASGKLQAAAVDTVRISAANHRTGYFPVTSYQIDMGILVLQFVDTCTVAQTPSGDGHGAGTDYMSAGCHSPADAGPGTANPSRQVVTACGTVYTTASGGTTVAGATVRLIDRSGNIAMLTTSPTGVFWLGESCSGYFSGPCVANDSATRWDSAAVSKCPTIQRMTTKSAGHCGSCHSGTNQIHLP